MKSSSGRMKGFPSTEGAKQVGDPALSLHCQCMRGTQTLLNLENLLSYTNKIHVLNVKTISQNTAIYIIALKNLYKIY